MMVEKKYTYTANNKIGDMSAEEFRNYGHQMIDWIADYLSNIEKYPVLSQVNPGDIKRSLPSAPPIQGESMENIFKDVEAKILPGITHWNHPGFMAYFNSTSSGPGILAELLSAAFNANGMLWRTSPALTELEEVTLNWFRKMLGLKDDFWGIIYDTASVSTMHAIAAAREQIEGVEIRRNGLTAKGNIRGFRFYASEQAHSSIDKASITLGFGIEGLRKIPVDKEFRMIPSELKSAIEEDRKNGWTPFCVVATVGTTSTTSIDPVDKIADICEKEKLWLHVDSAHAGVTAIIPEMRYIFNGVERADSLVVNPHKWMFTPVDLSVLLTRKKNILKRAFSLVPEYLKSSGDAEVENYMDYGIQLGRRFRALKLWFIIRYFGTEGIANRLKEHLRLGKIFSDWIINNPNFELMAPVPFSTTCFRAYPKGIIDETNLDVLNEALLNNVNSTGKIFLTHTKLNGKYVIRLVISGLRTEGRHITLAEQIIQTKLDELIAKGSN